MPMLKLLAVNLDRLVLVHGESERACFRLQGDVRRGIYAMLVPGLVPKGMANLGRARMDNIRALRRREHAFLREFRQT